MTVIRPSGTPVEGTRTISELRRCRSTPELLVLGFKPQKLDEIAPELRRYLSAGTVVVSLLAGVEADSLRERFPGAAAIVRAMPNLPVAVRRGVTGLYSADAGDAVRDEIGNLFSALGFAMWMGDEAKFAALGAVAGAGPAYVARFIAALDQSGREARTHREIAEVIARETVLGTAWMAATDERGHGFDRPPRREPQWHDRSRAGGARPRAGVLDRLVADTIEPRLAVARSWLWRPALRLPRPRACIRRG